jgi:hypothetical protein
MSARPIRRGLAAALLFLIGVGPAWGQEAPPDTTAPPAAPTALPDTVSAPTTLARAPFSTLGGGQSASRPYRQEPSVYFGAPPLRHSIARTRSSLSPLNAERQRVAHSSFRPLPIPQFPHSLLAQSKNQGQASV